VVDDLFAGQFNNPIRVIAFNIGEGWSRDVSDQVARELLDRVAKEDEPLGRAARRFVEFHPGEAELLRASINAPRAVEDWRREGVKGTHNARVLAPFGLLNLHRELVMLRGRRGSAPFTSHCPSGSPGGAFL
jgi:hypothetical protein